MKRTRRIIPLAALVLVALGGCYQRTVSSKGFGSRTRDVHEPNVKTGDDRGLLDGAGDLLFGEPTTERTNRRYRAPG
ncbi:MAG: hypothetical protein AAGI17_07470 [Planctomycetota bacterium]